MRESKRRYLEEYEKYKDIVLELNEVYSKKSKTSEKVEVVDIDEDSIEEWHKQNIKDGWY